MILASYMVGTQPKRTLAVIGTAGRKSDGDMLHKSHWVSMVKCVCRVIHMEGVTDLVSGGAAWADHVAVEVSRTKGIPAKLYLPSDIEDTRIAEYYHLRFGRVILRDTLADIASHTDKEYGGSFKQRNSLVADAADVFVAMTFGGGSRPKDGGTMDTVSKMMRRGVRGYHLDLYTFKLHECTL